MATIATRDSQWNVAAVRGCGLEVEEVDRQARQLVKQMLDAGFRLPTLPVVAAEVMSIANATDVTFVQVDRIVRRDPLIAARVLTVVNSPVFRAPSPIVSLRAAMMRLGWQTLREVLWQAMAEAYVFRGTAQRRLRALRLHGVAVAHLARRLAAEASVASEHAFACGLLHDMGRPLALRVLADRDHDLNPVQQQCVVDAVHGVVGGRIAQSWGLPDEIVAVINDHHNWEPPALSSRSQSHPIPTRNGDTVPPMALVIAAAECLAYHHGLGEKQWPLDAHGAALLSALGIGDDAIDTLLEEAESLHLDIS